MHLYTSEVKKPSPNFDMANVERLGETKDKKETEKDLPIDIAMVR